MNKANLFAKNTTTQGLLTEHILKLLPETLQKKLLTLRKDDKPTDIEEREKIATCCLTENAYKIPSRSALIFAVWLEDYDHAVDFFSQDPNDGLYWFFRGLEAIYRFEDLKREKQLAIKIEQIRKQTLKELQWQQLTTSLKTMLTTLFDAAAKFFSLYLAKTKLTALITAPGLTRSVINLNADDLSLAVWQAIPNIFGQELDSYRLPCNRQRVIALLGPLVKPEAKNSNYHDSLVIKILLDTELFLAEFAQAPDKIELLNQLFVEWKTLYANATTKRLALANAAMAKAKQEIIDEFALQDVKLTKEAKQLVQAAIIKVCDNIAAELKSE